MCRVGTLRPGDFLVRFSTGTGTLGARTLPLPLPLLLVRHEGVRERDVVRFGMKSPSEDLTASLSPDALPKSSSGS